MHERAVRPDLRSTLVLALLVWFHMTGTAVGTWTSPPSPPSMTVSSATLESATGLAAANGTCEVLVLTRVDLSWSATGSAFADGYEIFRSPTSGGPYTSIGTVVGRTTTTYTDATVLFSTTYHYVVQATKNSWRSANSTQASVTTPTSLCV